MGVSRVGCPGGRAFRPIRENEISGRHMLFLSALTNEPCTSASRHRSIWTDAPSPSDGDQFAGRADGDPDVWSNPIGEVVGNPYELARTKGEGPAGPPEDLILAVSSCDRRGFMDLKPSGTV